MFGTLEVLIDAVIAVYENNVNYRVNSVVSVVRPRSENCQNNVDNFAVVHDIITQPVPINCPQKFTFCTINSVS